MFDGQWVANLDKVNIMTVVKRFLRRKLVYSMYKRVLASLLLFDHHYYIGVSSFCNVMLGWSVALCITVQKVWERLAVN